MSGPAFSLVFGAGELQTGGAQAFDQLAISLLIEELADRMRQLSARSLPLPAILGGGAGNVIEAAEVRGENLGRALADKGDAQAVQYARRAAASAIDRCFAITLDADFLPMRSSSSSCSGCQADTGRRCCEPARGRS